MMRKLNILVFLSVLAAVFISGKIFAAEVTKVKGANALIDLKGDSAAVGDMFFALSADGKKRGILQVTKVKGEKAIAKITKGRAEAGMTLQAKGGAVAGGKRAKKSGSSGAPGDRSYWGGLLGISMDSMKVNVKDFSNSARTISNASLTGNAFSGMGLFDYEVFPQIWFRGLGGVEGFSVSGDSICGLGNKAICNASIYYLSFDFLGRYVFSEGNIRPWLGGGIALMFPVSKSSSALDAGSISNTSVIMLSGGADWFISPTMYIPISIEYGLLPKSNEVEATWIELRAGLAVPF